MSNNFYYMKIVISGARDEVDEFRATYLMGNAFDFGAIIPMPSNLDMDFNNLVETGYEALYGDWAKVAKFWMFKEPAQQKGYLFPLESREEVIDCLKSFACADSYLVSGRRFQENLDNFGHGSRVTWREESWGARGNAEGTKVATFEGMLVFWFIIDKYPAKVLRKLSCLHPALNFRISMVDENKRIGRKFRLANGREIEKQKIPILEFSDFIHEYEAMAMKH
jgi:hypothetical protein